MKAIKIILISLGAVIVLVLIVAAFISKEMIVEESIVIDKPAQQVYDYIKYLKNHESFSVWAKMDPDMKKEYRGTDGAVGSIFFWQSDKQSNVGTGEEEIKNMVNGQRIEFELRFLKPYQTVAFVTMTTEASGENQTKVTWRFKSEMKYPVRIMKPLFAGKLKENLAEGLGNLKRVLEK